MARTCDPSEIDPDLIRGKTTAIIGFGSQGHAHALNLRDSGVRVLVGLHPTSRSRERAQVLGFEVRLVADAVRDADYVALLTPDVPMAEIFVHEVEPHLRPGAAVVFAHGFNVVYERIVAPEGVDFVLVSPKGPGPGLRAEYEAGRGLPAFVAVDRDASGNALGRALAYAWGIGCARNLVLETTFRDETECDLFGEQAVLCGGISALVQAGFDTLVEAGYSPEVAYFEVLHETRLIVELLVAGGLTYLHEKISETAEWGDLVAGKQVIGQASRTAMRAVLDEIRSGAFARDWVAENEAGLPRLRAHRMAEPNLLVERVGSEIRRRMFGRERPD